jgi:serine phosphatase RsbU (regulator of sigma subunit)
MPNPIDFATALRSATTVDPASVVDLVAAAAHEIGCTDVRAYLVDFEQRFLEPLPDLATHPSLASTEEVVSTMAGRAFLTRGPVTAERPEGVRVWVPIIEGSDRTGVLAVTLPSVNAGVLAQCCDLGILAGYLIAAHARCTDLYQLHRRRRAMSLAANMQWDLLPPVVLTSRRCTLAARLEPAYDVGGDCFDYALNGAVLDVGMIDAMGHGVTSATIASLAIGCYRHSRREGHSLLEMDAALNTVLCEQLAGEAFATGQLAQLELDTGTFSWVNAGHPCPLLVRGGQVIKQLEGAPGLPWGLAEDDAELHCESLERGDGILFFTDGVIEARSSSGEDFGLERLIDIVGQCASDQLPAEEIVRKVVENVLEHQEADLRDDATVFLVEWLG